MNLKLLLKRDFGMEFPISGGTGNSMDNAIVIHRTEINDYTGYEYEIIRCISSGRNVSYKVLGQSLLRQNDKVFDKLKVEITEFINGNLSKGIENYYFDITECFGRDTKTQQGNEHPDNDIVSRESLLALCGEESDFEKEIRKEINQISKKKVADVTLSRRAATVAGLIVIIITALGYLPWILGAPLSILALMGTYFLLFDAAEKTQRKSLQKLVLKQLSEEAQILNKKSRELSKHRQSPKSQP